MLSLLLLGDLLLVGVITTYFCRLKFLLEERLLSATVIGLTVLGYGMLLFSFLFKLNLISLLLFLAFFNLAGFSMLRGLSFKTIKDDWVDVIVRINDGGWQKLFGVLLLFSLAMGFLGSKLITYEVDRLFVKPVHAFGDISGHLGLISSFAYGNNIPMENPILSGEKISYPFLFDFITAVFVNPLMLQPYQAITLTGTLMMVVLALSLGFFALKLTKDKLAAVFTLLIFFLNGGFGFVYFFEDLANSNLNIWQHLLTSSRDYTAYKEQGFWWINIIISILLPQRGVLLGLPIALLVLRIFWDLVEEFDLRGFILAVALTASLPLIHAHSFLALAPFISWFVLTLFIRYRQKIPQMIFIGICGLTAAFMLSRMFLYQSENLLKLLRVQLGWVSAGEQTLWFYIANFGAYLMALPLSIWFYIRSRSKPAVLFLIGQVWFILPSFLVFQPWDYDNTKLFLYWLAVSAVLLGYFLSKAVSQKDTGSIVFAAILIVLLTFAGLLDVSRLFLLPAAKYEIYSPASLKVAEFVKGNTPPEAVFLSVDKFDNPAVTLAGRKVILGYRGWLWTHGLDFRQRERDVALMLAGGADREMFAKYKVSHVILFDEQPEFAINRSYFDKNFKLIYDASGYTIYQR